MRDLFQPPRMIDEARATGRGHKWIVELLIFILVFFIIWFIEGIPVAAVMLAQIFIDPSAIAEAAGRLMEGDAAGYASAIRAMITAPKWMDLITLFATVLMTVTAILFCRWFEKRRTPTLGFRRSGFVKEYLVGILAALVMISAAVGIGMLTGAYRFERRAVPVSVLALYMVGFIIQGMGEEVVCRGYLMVSISRKNPVWLAVLLSSIVFGVLHLGNPGVSLLAFINLVLSGAVFAVYVLKRGNIWGACALHSFWNFFQGNVFGISVSGSGVTASPLIAKTAQDMPLWSGGAFGIEGGLCDTIVEIAALVILIFLVPKKTDEFSACETPEEI